MTGFYKRKEKLYFIFQRLHLSCSGFIEVITYIEVIGL